MKWCNFLHFYQPFSQQKDILEAVANQCYRPLFKGLLGKNNAKLTVNISGALFELLDKYRFYDVIDNIRELYKQNKIEITSTSCYHAFLPLLPEKEVVRQIELNNKVLSKYLGNSFKPLGFFPPEMACTSRLLDIINDLKFQYILLDEIAYKNGAETSFKNVNLAYVTSNKMFRYSNTSLKVFYRHRVPSNILMSGIERYSNKIVEIFSSYKNSKYLITAMDGETFGHHRPGLEQAFLELFDDKDIKFSFISELCNENLPAENVEVNSSTWASSHDDIQKGIQFISWSDPSNKIHKWQWELVNIMLSLIYRIERSLSINRNATQARNTTKKDSQLKRYKLLRSLVDKALASDQFFWASAKPWWSVEMIESGAYACLYAIEKISKSLKISLFKLERAQTLYRNIISTAFDWQRSGKIRQMHAERNIAQRIPFKA